MKMTWREVLAGYSDEHIQMSAEEDDFGMLNVKVNNNTLFEGTRSDAYVTFIALSKLFGPKRSKSLLKLKGPGERYLE